MKKAVLYGIGGLAVLCVVALAAFLLWALNPSAPGPDALAALQSDATVKVVDTGDYIAFVPRGQTAPTAFVFYPGGHVDYRAYSPILFRIAHKGYLVVLVRVKLCLAFFDIDAGLRAFDAFPEVQSWVAGGHSLGGVAAAMFAQRQPKIAGLVFWASYPPNDKLKASGLRMLSIYGSEDGGLDDGAKIEQHKAFQPDDTIFVELAGANHGQFGDYGPQPGDNPATISSESQWLQSAQITSDFLASFGQ